MNFICYESYLPLYKVISRHAKQCMLKGTITGTVENSPNPFYALKERIKTSRRKAYLEGDNEGYKLAMLQELSLESDCYEQVMQRMQQKLLFTEKQYQQSMQRFQFDREKSEELKTTLHKVNLQVR